MDPAEPHREATQAGGRIVVGIDGSAVARQALAWAVAEARLRAATLEIVSVWEDPYSYWGERMPTPEAEAQERTALVLARTLLQDALAEVRAQDEHLSATVVELEGSAAARLIEQSATADLLVVGSRGRGGFAGLALGSVSQQCIAHAACPVVVIRAPRPEHAPDGHGRAHHRR